MATGSKLAVIVHADVAGSTALVRTDEGIAHDRIQAAFRRSSDIISKYGGITHELRGDALVAEFERASDAVSAALALQILNEKENARLAGDIRPVLRLGISLGEVVVADDTLTGPGVVLAQRVEQLAVAGGVAVTEAIREAVPERMPFEYEDHGLQHLKGFDLPVHVFSARLMTAAEVPPPARTARGSTPIKQETSSTRVWIAASLGLVLLLGIALILWLKPWDPTADVPPRAEIPDRPSIAVLPFDNVSDDTEQEYFADGLTDDLIIDLSKLSGLFVVSRNSVFTFKDNPVRAQDVARELGVLYVLEGAVRRAADRVRVNAQLVNGSTGHHVWAERYDREITDIFRVQDELVTEIVKALRVQLTPAEESQVGRAPTRNLEAYDYFLRARESYFSGDVTRQGESLGLFQRAIQLDPEFAVAHAGLARLAADVWRKDTLVILNTALARSIAEESATRALDLDPEISEAHSVLALIRMVDGQHEFAQQLAQRAVDLAPNSADAYTALAVVLGFAGEHGQALEAIRTALRLNPRPPVTMQSIYGWVLFMNRQYEDAIAVLEPIVKDRDMPFGDYPGETLAMAYAQAGRIEEAKSRMEITLRNSPFANLSYYEIHYRHHARASDLEHRVEALRKAGVPEHGLGFEGDPAHRVDEPLLNELIAAGRTWQGIDAALDQPFVQELLGQNQFVYATGTTMMTGTATVRDGQLCESYETRTFGRENCGHVYRNPNGTRDGLDEYTYVNPTALRHFSPVR